MKKRKKHQYPQIGLALGSGVARGWAHIGVLKVLTQAGFVPDIVSGTSIGAVVGGFYVTERLSEIEDFAKQTTRRSIFGLTDLSLSGSALFSGRRLAAQLQEHLGNTQIQDLKRTFIPVATELSTGHEIWLRHGSLVDALRASYALPGVFSPVHSEGRWLIDGALVNPVPSSVCRAFGARLVIAVNLNRDAFGKASTSKPVLQDSEDDEDDLELEGTPADPNAARDHGGRMALSNYRTLMNQFFGSSETEKVPGMTTVLLAALNIVQDRLARSRLAGDPPDITITPRVGHISLLEFESAAEAIECGVRAAEATLPHIEEAARQLI